MIKKLPIGIQDFPQLIEEGYLYVDKTEHYHRLITQGAFYFLSRPRRFGKSLLISTLTSIFEGRRELFEGLWIHDKIDWKPHPVILLDFTRISKSAGSLEEGLRLELERIASNYGHSLPSQTNAGRLQELIQLLSQEGRKVAILVDEYDKPLIDNIDDLDLLNQNRQVLKDFYSVLKGNGQHIAFLMLTGITKFSQVSIFSDLNHLLDITLHEDYSEMLGYTQREIEVVFADYVHELRQKTGDLYPDLMAEIRAWYNGYSWDGTRRLYNPFSVLSLFSRGEFGEYWFATGTPTFLMKLIRAQRYGAFDIENAVMSLRSLNRFDVPNIEINSLLFQTGYLTIKKKDTMRQAVTLDFPNREVANAFSAHLLAELSEKGTEKTDALVFRMADQLRAGDVEAFVQALRSIFAGIAYPIQPDEGSGIDDTEKFYHTMFYLVLRLLGYDIHTEVLTHDGRIDAVVGTDMYIYVVEFKLGDAAAAMAQIKAKRYHERYLVEGKKVVLLAIGFDTAKRQVGEFLVERDFK